LFAWIGKPCGGVSNNGSQRMGLHYVRIYEQLIAWTRSTTVVRLRLPGQNARSAAQISAAHMDA
jgi:hypothetical protein